MQGMVGTKEWLDIKKVKVINVAYYQHGEFKKFLGKYCDTKQSKDFKFYAMFLIRNIITK